MFYLFTLLKRLQRFLENLSITIKNFSLRFKIYGSK